MLCACSVARVPCLVCLQVLVNDHVTKAVTLVNAGSLLYEYGWRLGSNPHLAITPQAGSVGPGDRTVCELTFSPTSSRQRLDRYKVTCHVVNGRTYTLLLSGELLPLSHEQYVLSLVTA